MTTPLIIVQARTGGFRFPGKMLAPLLGQPLILWTLQRIQQLEIPHRLVVILPQGPENDVLRRLCEKHGYECLQPQVPETNLLARYRETATDLGADLIVRLTADCPLVDTSVIEGCLDRLGRMPWNQPEKTPYDHVGIAAEWPDGQDCEVFTMNALEHAYQEAEEPADTEHCTPYIWKNPHLFRCATYPCPMDLSQYQYSVDTLNDLLLVEGILAWCLERYGFGFTWRDIWWTLEANPHLKQLMLQRPPRNQSYVTQTGSTTWIEARYGRI